VWLVAAVRMMDVSCCIFSANTTLMYCLKL
jgi:hypothetical protein